MNIDKVRGPSADTFLTIGAEVEAETRVRGSRFIAVARPIGDEGEARQFLGERTRSLFDASHHCAAWRLRDGAWRAIDAGEPSGSAGAPILAAVDAVALVDVAVVVSRYFGGTKLGVGGLARAYSEAAGAALTTAPKVVGTFGMRNRIGYDYAQTAAVMRAIELFDAEAIEHGFADGLNEPQVSFSLPRSRVEKMGSYLREASGGSLSIQPLGPVVLYRPSNSAGAV